MEARHQLGSQGTQKDAAEAHRIGVVHHLATEPDGFEEAVRVTVKRALRCAPEAVAVTKALVRRRPFTVDDAVIDELAGTFADALRGPEGSEGVAAFAEKRRAPWAIE